MELRHRSPVYNPIKMKEAKETWLIKLYCFLTSPAEIIPLLARDDLDHFVAA